VALSGGATATATAASGGAAASTVTVTGLQPNTSYTAQITVTDEGGVTGPAYLYPSQLTTNGPPAVSGVTVSGNGQAVNVTPTINPGGEQAQCQETVSVSGGGSATGACGATVTISVPMYNTSYTATVTATNSAGSSSGTGTANSGDKALTADATTAFGTCGGTSLSARWCGGNSNMQPGAAFTDANGTLVTQGTTVLADCWTSGGADHGETSAYPPTTGYYDWLHIAQGPGAPGYMAQLWFPDPNSATAGLPGC
jgi:hypothetical protein